MRSSDRTGRGFGSFHGHSKNQLPGRVQYNKDRVVPSNVTVVTGVVLSTDNADKVRFKGFLTANFKKSNDESVSEPGPINKNNVVL